MPAEITTWPEARYADVSAAVLCLFMPWLRWRRSWLVPGEAVWALDGEPQLPIEESNG